jgi:hypothetical protein
MAADKGFFVTPADVDGFGFDWGRLSLTVGPEVNGAERFSGGVVDLPAGQGHARHNHPGAEEIIFVVSGQGEQMVEDDNGVPQVCEIGPAARSMSPKAASTRHSIPARGRCGSSSSIPPPVRNWGCATCRTSACSGAEPPAVLH